MKKQLYAVALLVAPTVAAQYRLNLSEALTLATNKSEAVDIARAGVDAAAAEQIRARAQRLPQVYGNASYTRTLRTQFAGLFNNQPSGVPCDPLNVNPAVSVEQRVSELERFLVCGGPAAVAPTSDGDAPVLPFGRTNIYTLGFTASQALYTGGRVGAQNRLADSLFRSATLELDSTDAQFLLDVSTAFYDAVLADLLLAIARESLGEAEKTLEYVQLGFKVGRLPEFDVLRAAVSRRNQRSTVARRFGDRETALLRFKQLIDLPPAASLTLETDLMADALPVPEPFDERFRAAEPLQAVFDRVPVQQADAAVQQREANLDIARAQRWPTISAVTDYGLFGYPTSFFPTSTNQFRQNWTVGAQLQVPILTFGRIRADVLSARANLAQSLAQRRLTRELAVLDTSVVLAQLQAAREEWEAASGGLTEARRAYEIAELRYRQGISSQLELDDIRLALQQARLNRAQAARDLQVTRIRVALLKDLPITVGPQSPSQTRPLQQQQSQQQFGGRGANPFANPAGATTQPPNAGPAFSGVPGVPAGQMGVPATTTRPQ